MTHDTHALEFRIPDAVRTDHGRTEVARHPLLDVLEPFDAQTGERGTDLVVRVRATPELLAALAGAPLGGVVVTRYDAAGRELPGQPRKGSGKET